ncbi:hypothetical protein PR003_g3193 [Phytophthora rubi]|uniref:RxLR effector protein n=1 Tax=Phytophthora rubi TaxID=129364 RepID=A0A6A3P2X3_9STRA|nr:hypothetical protein PR001_g2972 [Phytophthora rubi]KAE9354793.1 hypothetical protein PR003_g3193 [Phytophthora rubi]
MTIVSSGAASAASSVSLLSVSLSACASPFALPTDAPSRLSTFREALGNRRGGEAARVALRTGGIKGGQRCTSRHCGPKSAA